MLFLALDGLPSNVGIWWTAGRAWGELTARQTPLFSPSVFAVGFEKKQDAKCPRCRNDKLVLQVATKGGGTRNGVAVTIETSAKYVCSGYLGSSWPAPCNHWQPAHMQELDLCTALPN